MLMHKWPNVNNIIQHDVDILSAAPVKIHRLYKHCVEYNNMVLMLVP